MEFTRIIFVCRDNTSMSPMAEVIFRNIYNGKPVEVASGGLVVLFEGPVNPKVEVVLGSHGMTVSDNTTKPLMENEVHEATLLLTMNPEEKEELISRFPMAQVQVLNEYVNEIEITDPYGGSLMDYEKCFGQMSVIIKKLAMKLENN